MAKRIVILNGSPRQKGNSNLLRGNGRAAVGDIEGRKELDAARELGRSL